MGSDNDSSINGSTEINWTDPKSIWQAFNDSNSRKNSHISTIFMLAVMMVLLLLCLTVIEPTDGKMMAVKSEYPVGMRENVADFPSPVGDFDTALYWHIPKASGSSMKNYYGCMGLVIASQTGVTGGHDKDTTLQIWESPGGYKYVNVDTTKEAGIARAQQLGLAESEYADVVFSVYPHSLADIFTPEHRGRFFTLFRHPVDRAVSLFYHRMKAEWEKKEGVYKPELKEFGLENYLKEKGGGFLVSNGGYMVSSLLGKDRSEELTETDLNVAKEILRTKFLVGLTSRMEESVDRFDQYFGWYDSDVRQKCLNDFVRTGGGANTGSYNKLVGGSEAYNILAEMNSWDMQLYDYATHLFEEQAQFFPSTVSYAVENVG